MASCTHREHDVVLRLSRMDPIGIVEFEDDWSEMTPGGGPIEGCVFCKSTSATKDSGHEPGCLWEEAVRLTQGVPR